MKINHKPKLEWYAFEHDFNSDTIIRFNVLNYGILDRINKGLRVTNDYWKITNYEEMKTAVKRELMHHYGVSVNMSTRSKDYSETNHISLMCGIS